MLSKYSESSRLSLHRSTLSRSVEGTEINLHTFFLMVLDGGESLTLGNIHFIPSKELFVTDLLGTVFMWIQKKIIKINSCYSSVFENTTERFRSWPCFYVGWKDSEAPMLLVPTNRTKCSRRNCLWRESNLS
jgi:hypothetical protein